MKKSLKSRVDDLERAAGVNIDNDPQQVVNDFGWLCIHLKTGEPVDQEIQERLIKFTGKPWDKVVAETRELYKELDEKY